ncbi:MAG: hypothetical protein AVDCRST_MAG26-696 [uncultured Chloroflexia bacterium]|uniref:Uncharacterized protein n=1 Tax=uncultured Chloroflexia bacterium TaxID=1672391 RepID=A0A6J4HJ67_9CHLR|nr:MAG: hypothetical protein AVDCRST_MAG26-696 [uncultured Chloroflexia bacterium]
MDRQQTDEVPLHDSVLSAASTSEEVMLNRGEKDADAIAKSADEDSSAIIGTGGETTSAARLSNRGGVG